MKTYKLEVILDNKGVGVREKTEEGLTIVDARMIISVLEEYKVRMLDYVMFSQKQIDLKKQTKQ